MSGGVHVPACLSLEDHIDAARRETEGIPMTLDEFVAEVRHDWATERQMADAEAAILYWQRAEEDWQRWSGVSQ